MNASATPSARVATALLIAGSLVSGCSGSGDSPEPVGIDAGGADAIGETAGNGAADGVGGTDGTDEGAAGDPGPPAPATPVTPTDEPSAPAAALPDPLVQGSTAVEFDITVPAYVSDALGVRVSWGELDLPAEWIGDELWSASGDFPTDTENLLSITFTDGNGDVTLGNIERPFRTGTGDMEIVAVTADQFDTGRWDDDGDGVSNIDEVDEPTLGAAAPETPRVLLFSETRGFRHGSIPDALGALEELAASAGILTDRAVDSAGVFTDENLAGYDAVAWVLTSGDVLDADEQAAFERYIRAGGGYAGYHAASDTEYDWPWYGELVGAWFARHPAVQSATQNVEDGAHPSTAHLGASWTRTDEWYDYRSNPRAEVNVLLSLDEGSYSGGGMGEDHPSAWYHDHDGGRSWYTGGGHTAESYAEPDFRAHLLGGLRHAAGLEVPNDTPTEPDGS